MPTLSGLLAVRRLMRSVVMPAPPPQYALAVERCRLRVWERWGKAPFALPQDVVFDGSVVAWTRPLHDAPALALSP